MEMADPGRASPRFKIRRGSSSAAPLPEAGDKGGKSRTVSTIVVFIFGANSRPPCCLFGEAVRGKYDLQGREASRRERRFHFQRKQPPTVLPLWRGGWWEIRWVGAALRVAARPDPGRAAQPPRPLLTAGAGGRPRQPGGVDV